jgi:hypothetical protein
MESNLLERCILELEHRYKCQCFKFELHLDNSKSKSIVDSNFKVLILLEPPSVMPENYNPRSWNSFNLVISLSPWRSFMYGMSHVVFQPLKRPEIMNQNKFRQSRITLINEFKFGSVTSSLYGWRLELLKKLSQKGVEVKVFGPNWNMSRTLEVRKRWAATRRAIGNPNFDLLEAWSSLFFRPKDYCGQALDKLSTLSEFEYTIVVENDKYSLTEKLFDAVFSGVKVFYRGPNLSQFEYLDSLCAQLPEEVDDAVAMILGRQKIDWRVYQGKGLSFINDSGSMAFCEHDNVARGIVDIIDNSLEFRCSCSKEH